MEETIFQDNPRNKRRKKIIVRNNFYVFGCYVFSQLATLIAKWLGFSTSSYFDIILILSFSLVSVVTFSVITLIKKEITKKFAYTIFFSQFFVWLVFYAFWVFFLGEIRSVAMYFAILGLIFMFAGYIRIYQALAISLTTVIIQLIISYVAIKHFNQKGNFIFEAFIIMCYLPCTVFISYLSSQFRHQRDDLKLAKRMAEKVRDALWGEMELAKKIQTVLLPGEPKLPGYSISAFMDPAAEIGGDYYDVINAGERNWVLIGDVTGHGVPAGLVMMMVQTAVRVMVTNHPLISPANLLKRINRSIYASIRQLKEDKHMTIIALSFEPGNRIIYSGMHEDMLMFRAGSGSIEIIKPNGMWIGLKEEIGGMLVNTAMTMNRGDILLLYTDGLIDALDKSNTPFTKKKLTGILKDNGDRTADEIKKLIQDELVNYREIDDVTFLAIKKD